MDRVLRPRLQRRHGVARPLSRPPDVGTLRTGGEHEALDGVRAAPTIEPAVSTIDTGVCAAMKSVVKPGVPGSASSTITSLSRRGRWMLTTSRSRCSWRTTWVGSAAPPASLEGCDGDVGTQPLRD